MKNKMMIVSAAILSVVASAGCKQSPSPTLAQNQGHLSSSPVSGAKLGGVLSSTVIRYETPTGYADRFDTRALFYNDSGHVVRPTSVAINGHALPPINSWNGDLKSVSFGSSQVWSVSGSGAVPSFSDTLGAPSVPMISYPRFYTDSVSVSSGYTVHYASPGTDSVGIYVMYDSISSLTRCGVQHGFHSFFTGAANTGSFVLTSSDLSGFPSSGVILVTVSAIATDWQYLSSKNYSIWASASSECYTYLKP